MIKNVIVLMPGGFKPPHGGHLSLMGKYSELSEVKEIWVLIGPSIRDGIPQEKAVKMMEKLTEDMPKVVVIASPDPSPVLAAYNIIKEAEPGVYALAASSKEPENEKRIQSFVFKHSSEGKFYREDIQVIELPVDITPLYFEGRTDEHEGEPISARVLRQDMVNGDLDNFMTGYPNSTEDQISFIWDFLEQNIELPESEPMLESIHTEENSEKSEPKEDDKKNWNWDGKKWTRKK